DLESRDDPLDLPDDDRFNLWALRRKLLEVEPDEEAAEAWTWVRMVAALDDELGYAPAGGTDPLYEIGAHFFPSVLEREGGPVPPPSARGRDDAVDVEHPARRATPLRRLGAGAVGAAAASRLGGGREAERDSAACSSRA